MTLFHTHGHVYCNTAEPLHCRHSNHRRVFFFFGGGDNTRQEQAIGGWIYQYIVMKLVVFTSFELVAACFFSSCSRSCRSLCSINSIRCEGIWTKRNVCRFYSRFCYCQLSCLKPFSSKFGNIAFFPLCPHDFHPTRLTAFFFSIAGIIEFRYHFYWYIGEGTTVDVVKLKVSIWIEHWLAIWIWLKTLKNSNQFDST